MQKNLHKFKEAALHIFTVLLPINVNKHYRVWLEKNIIELDDTKEVLDKQPNQEKVEIAKQKEDTFLEDPCDEEKQLLQCKRSKFYEIGLTIFRNVEQKQKN